MSAVLDIYLNKIYHNAKGIIEKARDYNVDVFGVTKVFCADIKIVNEYVRAGVYGLADSRIENIINLRYHGYKLPIMLLRLPSISEVEEVVCFSDISLNSEVKTLVTLNDAAFKYKRKHKVIIMIDVGDLREGIMPDRAMDFFSEIVNLNNIEIIGIGTNTACFGGVIPTRENLGILLRIKKELESKFSLDLGIISGGNSSALYLLYSGDLPQGINNFRIGESIVLGRNVINREPFPGTFQDTFILRAEIIELSKKPSVPMGERGQDAFGKVSTFKDRGEIHRGIVAIGRQDVLIDGLIPVRDDISILGASSDHLIIEFKNGYKGFSVGDFVSFYPNYGALLALMTSKYVKKRYIYE